MDSEIRFLLSCLAVIVAIPTIHYLVETLGRRYDDRQYRRAVAAKERRVSVSR